VVYRDTAAQAQNDDIQIVRFFYLLLEDAVVDTCVQYIYVQDKVKPNAVCKNTLVTLSDETAFGVVFAADVASESTDNCGLDGLSFSFTSNFGQPSLTVNCSDELIGQLNLKVYVRDTSGNVAQCNFVLTVNKNSDATCACDDDDNVSLTVSSASIESGVYASGKTLDAVGKVESDSVVAFSAGDRITLKPGFYAEKGSDFTAYIAYCIPASGGLDGGENTGITEGTDDNNLEGTNVTDRAEGNAGSTENVRFLSGNDVQVFPNPFKNTATVLFNLPEPSTVNMYLNTLTGSQSHQVISNTYFKAGIQEVQIDGTNLQGGIYLLIIEADGQTAIRRIIRME
jgi:hypothetical protein